MRIKTAWLVALLAALILPGSHAFGWVETGHRETATIAWDDLTPATKARIVAILKQHPRYEQDLLAHIPADYTGDAVSAFAFRSAAVWPDTVRGMNNPMHATHNHPAWHYIDIPYAINGQPIPESKPPAEGNGPANILEALTKNVADLNDPAISMADQAVAICWVLHLCGDIHQPLHAVSLYSPQFPDGDRGGNSILVMRDPPYPDSVRNLHYIWDSMPGDFKSDAYAVIFARGLKAAPKYSREKLREALTVRDFPKWADESHALAIQYVYVNGKLTGATKPFRNDAPATRRADEPPIPGLTAEYLRDAEEIAAQRIAVGGYRTADLLNSIYDPMATPANNSQLTRPGALTH